MMLLQLLMAVCLFHAINSEKCKTPTPMSSFSMKRLLGIWYHAAFDVRPDAVSEVFKNASCGVSNTYTRYGGSGRWGRWTVDMDLGPNLKSDLGGAYYVPDPSKGLMKLFYKAGNFTYDFTITCTDYVTYFTSYACVSEPNNFQEFVFLYLRNVSMYDEVVSRRSLQKCYRGITTKSVQEIQRRPYTGCSYKTY